MASIADKFRKIRIAPSISFARQSWIDYVERVGWVWSDSRMDWSITVGGQTFWGQELTIAEWKTKIDQKLAESGNSVTPTNTGTYELRFDATTNSYFYYNTLGQKIYEYTQGSNPSADILVGDTILEKPNYDVSDNDLVLDILKNPIKPKKPEVGLYDTKQYFDYLQFKKNTYKEFYAAKTQAEKNAALQKMANAIVNEEARALAQLNDAQVAKIRDTGVAGLIGTVAFSLGVVGKASAAVIGAVSQYAQQQTTDRRLQLIAEDVVLLDKEYNAIKEYFAANKSKLAAVTAASSATDWLKKNWAWIIGAAVSVGLGIFLYRTSSNEKR